MISFLQDDWRDVRRLTLHPTQVAETQGKTDSEEVVGIRAQRTDTCECTCHPDDNPPRPCPRKFALNECRTESERLDDLCDYFQVEGVAARERLEGGK